MRKYDIKNKRNIGIIVGISVLIVIMFSLVIRLFLNTDRMEFTVDSGTLVFDKDKSIIKLDDKGIIKTKWNKEYYLIYNKKNYELGNTAISYNENTGEIKLYGRYYEIGSGEEIKVTNDETVIKNSALTKFYKLADRKYLVIDKEIKSSDGLLSTTDFLMVDLDKVGNATFTNHKISLKSFSETVIVTSNYTFDIANEILTYGSDKIDLKKIIGSSNTYTKEDLVPEINGNDGVTNLGDGGGNDQNLEGNDVQGEGNGTVIEEIKKASKNTSIIAVTSSASKIDIDYVVYDPYHEYTSVYMEVSRAQSNSVQTIYLNSNETNYVISNDIFPNTEYHIVFKCSYIDLDSGEEVRETIDTVNIRTKMPSLSLKVTSTSFGNITYQVSTDNSYPITSGTLVVTVNGVEKSRTEININGNTIGNLYIDDIKDNDIVELRLFNVKAIGNVINDLSARTSFKY